MDAIPPIMKNIDQTFRAGLKNPYIMAVVKIAITLYAAQMAPRLPAPVQNMFSNSIFKIGALTIIIAMADVDFQFALILAMAFVVSVNYMSGRGFLESYSNFSNEYKKSGAVLLEPKAAIYPGCHEITMADLLSVFNGDNVKLQKTVQYMFHELLQKLTEEEDINRLKKIAYATGLPKNIEFTDEHAPYIATILMYNGFQFDDDCRAPH